MGTWAGRRKPPTMSCYPWCPIPAVGGTECPAVFFVNPFGMGERGQGLSRGGEVGSQGFTMLMAGGGESWRKGDVAQ